MKTILINNKEQLIRLLSIVKETVELDIYPFTVSLEVKEGIPHFTIQGEKIDLIEVEKLWTKIN